MDESHLTPAFKLILVILILLFNVVYYILVLMRKKQRRREAEKLEGGEPGAPRRRPMETLEEILVGGEQEQEAPVQSEEEPVVETRRNDLVGIDGAAQKLLVETGLLRERIEAKAALVPLLRVIDDEILAPLEDLREEVHAILGDPLSREADILFSLRGRSTIVEKSFLLGVLREIVALRKEGRFEISIRPSAAIAEAFMKRLRELLEPFFPQAEELCAVAMPSRHYFSHPPEEKIAGAGILLYPAYDHSLPAPHGYAMILHILCANLIRSRLTDEALSSIGLPRDMRASAATLGADYLCSCILGPSYLLAMTSLTGGSFHRGRVDICLRAVPADADAFAPDVFASTADASVFPKELIDRVLSVPLLSGLSLSTIGGGARSLADHPEVRLVQRSLLSAPSDLAKVDPLCLLAGSILAAVQTSSSARTAALTLDALLRGSPIPAAREAAGPETPEQVLETGSGALQESVVDAIILGAILQKRSRPPLRR